MRGGPMTWTAAPYSSAQNSARRNVKKLPPTDFALIESELGVIQKQLVRLPTRRGIGPIMRRTFLDVIERCGFGSIALTKLVEKVPDGPDWLHEIRLDGYRM